MLFCNFMYDGIFYYYTGLNCTKSMLFRAKCHFEVPLDWDFSDITFHNLFIKVTKFPVEAKSGLVPL